MNDFFQHVLEGVFCGFICSPLVIHGHTGCVNSIRVPVKEDERVVRGPPGQEILLNSSGPDHWYVIPAAAFVGVPFYVSVEALAPVGAALASKGMRVGAIFALTIAGAGVNVPEFALLTKMITRRGIIAPVGAVFAVAVGGGYAIQLLYRNGSLSYGRTHVCPGLSSSILPRPRAVHRLPLSHLNGYTTTRPSDKFILQS